MHKYYYTIIGLLLSHLLCAQAPVIVEGGTSFTPTVPLTVNYTSNAYVYRASTEIIFKAGFEVTQTGNNTTKYFLAYINTPNTSGVFAELKEEQDDSYCLALNAVLTFKYDEKYFVNTSSPLSFVIYNYKMQPMSCPAISKNYGLNYLKLDLIGYDFIQGQYYTMVVTGEKGEKKYLRFRYFQR